MDLVVNKSKHERPSVNGRESEEADAIERFHQCCVNIARQCDCVEQELSQKRSTYTTTTILENLKVLQRKLYKLRNRLHSTVTSEQSADLQPLEQRTRVRLAALIAHVSDELSIISKLSQSGNHDMLELDKIDAIPSSRNRKLMTQSLQYHNPISLPHDNGVQHVDNIDNCVIEQQNTVSKTSSHAIERDITALQYIPINTCDDHSKLNQPSLNARSTSSSRLCQLVQQREQLEHQISVARQGAEKRALQASRERLRQMDLEQDLMNTQGQIDAISCTVKSDDFRDQAHQDEARKYVRHAKSTYSETPADIDNLAKIFADAINLNKLPVPEPPIFDGNPLDYPGWKSSFDTLIGCKRINPGEKIHYLKRYLGGDAKSCVEGMFLFNTEAAYVKARELLQKRFGSDFAIGEAFRDKLYNWQPIADTDSDALRRYSDFLQQCDLAKQCIIGLECLDDCRENRQMLTKLPDYIIIKWNRIISEYTGYFPPFSTFSSFIAKEADVACNPITSLNAVRALSERNPIANVDKASTLVSIQSNPVKMSCRYCHKMSHKLHSCNSFIALKAEERSEFLQQKRLCFGCLEFGHLSKDCKMKKTCKVCTKRHPTCLHGDYEAIFRNNNVEEQVNEHVEENQLRNNDKPEEILNLHVSQDNYNSGMIVPVYVSSKQSPDKEILTYALLDTQSDSAFVLDQIGDALGSDRSGSAVKLSTLTSTSTIRCSIYSNLQVRGFKHDTKIPLPNTYARDKMPGNYSHINTQRTIKQWSHLRHLSNEIPDLQNCRIGLLIGYNCPQALAPRDFISGEGNVPFALKTLLGWSIVGMTASAHDEPELCNVSQKIKMTVPGSEVAEDPHNSLDSQLLQCDINSNKLPVQTPHDKQKPKIVATGYATRNTTCSKIKSQLESTTFMNCSVDTIYSVKPQTNSILQCNRSDTCYEINLDDQVYRGECKCTCR